MIKLNEDSTCWKDTINALLMRQFMVDVFSISLQNDLKREIPWRERRLADNSQL